MAGVEADEVGQGEGAHRVVGAELHPPVDVLRGAHALHQAVEGFVDHGHEDAVDLVGGGWGGDGSFHVLSFFFFIISKYILFASTDFKKILRNIGHKSILWKYFMTGLDTEYFDDKYKEIKNNNDNTIITKGLNILYSVLIFIVIAPLLYFYNTTTFGLTINPSWYNLIYQALFLVNIVGNIICFYKKSSYLIFNITFLVILIVLIIIISIIIFLT